jgi:hypothetical protein
MSSTTPSATRKSASLARLQVENGRSWSWGRDRASCLIARRWARVKVGGRPPRYRGYSESNPSRLKLCSTSRTRSGLVKVTWAIWATSMPWALSSTICARRQVTTEPVDRRTMRSSRLPSWLLIPRTRTRSATLAPSTTRCRRESSPGCRQACDQPFQPNRPTLPDEVLAPVMIGCRARMAGCDVRRHPVPYRTRKLSPPAPMVLPGQLGGRVGRRRDSSRTAPPSGGAVRLSPGEQTVGAASTKE